MKKLLIINCLHLLTNSQFIFANSTDQFGYSTPREQSDQSFEAYSHELLDFISL